MLLRSIVLALAMVYTCALVSGCGNAAEGEVIDQYQLGEDAIAAGDVVGLRNTYSPESTAWRIEMLRLAREASAAETRALDPAMMEGVVMLRNRLDAAVLRTMDVDRLLAWELDIGLITVDAEDGVKPHSVTITGDRAVLQMGEEVERSGGGTPRIGRRGTRVIGSLLSAATSGSDIEPIPGWTYTYVRIDGFWYADLVADMAEYDQWIRDSAKEEGKSVPDYIAATEKEAFGSLKPNVWSPVR